MKLIRSILHLTPAHRGCVLAIGNFDGVHRGHQALLLALREKAQTYQLPVIVMIFEPQPLELFAGEQAPARLMRLREKLLYLAQYGVDTVLCIRFNHHFASMTAQQFIDEFLIKQLAVKVLSIGDDFRFGSKRTGDVHLLQQAGHEHGFDVMQSPALCDNGIRISSTAIRQALKEDNLALAERLLGHRFMICGRVVHGNELGRTLGFPTANLPLRHQVCPIQGIFAVQVEGISDHPLPAVANIGTRPTICGVQRQLEVHIMDFNMNLYGRHIEVVLRKKLRNEQRFSSLEALRAQIANDAQAAREFFRQTNLVISQASHISSNHYSEYGIKTND